MGFRQKITIEVGKSLREEAINRAHDIDPIEEEYRRTETYVGMASDYSGETYLLCLQHL